MEVVHLQAMNCNKQLQSKEIMSASGKTRTYGEANIRLKRKAEKDAVAQQIFLLGLKGHNIRRIKKGGTFAIQLGNGIMADRRPLNPDVVVPKPGGGTQPRDRNNDGRVREKRSDAGKTRK